MEGLLILSSSFSSENENKYQLPVTIEDADPSIIAPYSPEAREKRPIGQFLSSKLKKYYGSGNGNGSNKNYTYNIYLNLKVRNYKLKLESSKIELQMVYFLFYHKMAAIMIQFYFQV